MKAAVYRGRRQMVVEEVPTPHPGQGQVLIRVKYCAICGTDVHLFQHDHIQPGSILGHEFCGTIAEVGEGVTNWKIGDRVVGGGGTPAPDTPHRLVTNPRFTYRSMGSTVSTNGAYAEYVLMEAWRPIPLPQGVPDEAAAQAEPCAVAVRAVQRSGVQVGDTVAVLGAGPVGLLCLQVARAQGAGRIYVSEPSQARAKAAVASGADRVFDPTRCDIVSEMVSLTEGSGPHVVFECAAAHRTLEQALEMARPHGRVVVVALAWNEVPVTPIDWVGREVDMVGSAGTTPEGWRTGLELMRQGKVRVEPMLSRQSYVPLERIQEAFVALSQPGTQLKVLIVP